MSASGMYMQLTFGREYCYTIFFYSVPRFSLSLADSHIHTRRSLSFSLLAFGDLAFAWRSRLSFVLHAYYFAMKTFSAALCLVGLWTAQSLAVAVPTTTDLQTRDLSDEACKNGPLTRACWSNGYSIATDFDQKFPTTGKTVTYNLEITNGTCNPDGHGERLCFLINGQYPGPTIRAAWGDFLSITVKNNMQDNGTSIHWHGVRQYHSPGSDGVGGLTECPIAPGSSKTYEFNVTQFGTSWVRSFSRADREAFVDLRSTMRTTAVNMEMVLSAL